MPLFDGVVLLDGEEIPVILGVEEDGIRLSSNGTEIGEWSDGDYRLTAGDGDSFLIAADDDSLTFVPYRPDAFARTVGIERNREEPLEAVPRSPDGHASTSAPADAPPPKPLTRALFYTLAGTTALLGVWALLRLFGA